MSHGPVVIKSADDLTTAIEWAGDNHKARWYVARMAQAFKRADLIPDDWDVDEVSSFREQPIKSEEDLERSAEIDKALDAFADTVDQVHAGEATPVAAAAMVASLAFLAEQGGYGEDLEDAITAGGQVYVDDGYISAPELEVLVAAAKGKSTPGDGVRKVRTLAGVKRYKAPIGTPIVKKNGKWVADRSAIKLPDGKTDVDDEVIAQQPRIAETAKPILTNAADLEDGDEILDRNGNPQIVTSMVRTGDGFTLTVEDEEGVSRRYTLPGNARVNVLGDDEDETAADIDAPEAEAPAEPAAPKKPTKADRTKRAKQLEADRKAGKISPEDYAREKQAIADESLAEYRQQGKKTAPETPEDTIKRAEEEIRRQQDTPEGRAAKAERDAEIERLANDPEAEAEEQRKFQEWREEQARKNNGPVEVPRREDAEAPETAPGETAPETPESSESTYDRITREMWAEEDRRAIDEANSISPELGERMQGETEEYRAALADYAQFSPEIATSARARALRDVQRARLARLATQEEVNSALEKSGKLRPTEARKRRANIRASREGAQSALTKANDDLRYAEELEEQTDSLGWQGDSDRTEFKSDEVTATVEYDEASGTYKYTVSPTDQRDIGQRDTSGVANTPDEARIAANIEMLRLEVHPDIIERRKASQERAEARGRARAEKDAADREVKDLTAQLTDLAKQYQNHPDKNSPEALELGVRAAELMIRRADANDRHADARLALEELSPGPHANRREAYQAERARAEAVRDETQKKIDELRAQQAPAAEETAAPEAPKSPTSERPDLRSPKDMYARIDALEKEGDAATTKEERERVALELHNDFVGRLTPPGPRDRAKAIIDKLRAEDTEREDTDTPETPPADTSTNVPLADLEERMERDGGIVLYHGGLPEGTTLDGIDLNRNGTQQNKRGRSFGGFYLTDASSRAWSDQYASQRGGVMHGYGIGPDARILDLSDQGNGKTDRVSAEQRAKWAEDYDLVVGNDLLGRKQYLLLNKDVVVGVGETNVNNKDEDRTPAKPDTDSPEAQNAAKKRAEADAAKARADEAQAKLDAEVQRQFPKIEHDRAIANIPLSPSGRGRGMSDAEITRGVNATRRAEQAKREAALAETRARNAQTVDNHNPDKDRDPAEVRKSPSYGTALENQASTRIVDFQVEYNAVRENAKRAGDTNTVAAKRDRLRFAMLTAIGEDYGIVQNNRISKRGMGGQETLGAFRTKFGQSADSADKPDAPETANRPTDVATLSKNNRTKLPKVLQEYSDSELQEAYDNADQRHFELTHARDKDSKKERDNASRIRAAAEDERKRRAGERGGPVVDRVLDGLPEAGAFGSPEMQARHAEAERRIDALTPEEQEQVAEALTLRMRDDSLTQDERLALMPVRDVAQIRVSNRESARREQLREERGQAREEMAAEAARKEKEERDERRRLAAIEALPTPAPEQWDRDSLEAVLKVTGDYRRGRLLEYSDEERAALRNALHERRKDFENRRTLAANSERNRIDKAVADIRNVGVLEERNERSRDMIGNPVDSEGKPLKILGVDGFADYTVPKGEEYIDSKGERKVSDGTAKVRGTYDDAAIYRLGNSGYQQWAVVEQLPDGRVRIVGSQENRDFRVRDWTQLPSRTVDPRELTEGEARGRQRNETEAERRFRRGLPPLDASRQEIKSGESYRVTAGDREGEVVETLSALSTGADWDTVDVRFPDGTEAEIPASTLRRADAPAPRRSERSTPDADSDSESTVIAPRGADNAEKSVEVTATPVEDTERPGKLDYDTVTCERCSGTGVYAGGVDDKRCWECNGTGDRLTAEGAAAKDRYESLLTERMSVPVEDVKVGDRVKVPMGAAGNMYWAHVEGVTRTSDGRVTLKVRAGSKVESHAPLKDATVQRWDASIRDEIADEVLDMPGVREQGKPYRNTGTPDAAPQRDDEGFEYESTFEPAQLREGASAEVDIPRPDEPEQESLGLDVDTAAHDEAERRRAEMREQQAQRRREQEAAGVQDGFDFGMDLAPKDDGGFDFDAPAETPTATPGERRRAQTKVEQKKATAENKKKLADAFGAEDTDEADEARNAFDVANIAYMNAQIARNEVEGDAGRNDQLRERIAFLERRIADRNSRIAARNHTETPADPVPTAEPESSRGEDASMSRERIAELQDQMAARRQRRQEREAAERGETGRTEVPPTDREEQIRKLREILANSTYAEPDTVTAPDGTVFERRTAADLQPGDRMRIEGLTTANRRGRLVTRTADDVIISIDEPDASGMRSYRTENSVGTINSNAAVLIARREEPAAPEAPTAPDAPEAPEAPVAGTDGKVYRVGRGYQQWVIASTNEDGTVNLVPAPGAAPIRGRARNRHNVDASKLREVTAETATDAPAAPAGTPRTETAPATDDRIGTLRDKTRKPLSTDAAYTLGRGYQQWKVVAVNADGTVNLEPAQPKPGTRKRWNVKPSKLAPATGPEQAPAAPQRRQAETRTATPKQQNRKVEQQATATTPAEVEKAAAPRADVTTAPAAPEPAKTDAATTAPTTANKGMTPRVYRVLMEAHENRVAGLEDKVNRGEATAEDREALEATRKHIEKLRGEYNAGQRIDTNQEVAALSTPTPAPAPSRDVTDRDEDVVPDPADYDSPADSWADAMADEFELSDVVQTETGQWADLDDETIDALVEGYILDGELTADDAWTLTAERLSRQGSNYASVVDGNPHGGLTDEERRTGAEAAAARGDWEEVARYIEGARRPKDASYTRTPLDELTTPDQVASEMERAIEAGDDDYLDTLTTHEADLNERAARAEREAEEAANVDLTPEETQQLESANAATIQAVTKRARTIVDQWNADVHSGRVMLGESTRYTHAEALEAQRTIRAIRKVRGGINRDDIPEVRRPDEVTPEVLQQRAAAIEAAQQAQRERVQAIERQEQERERENSPWKFATDEELNQRIGQGITQGDYSDEIYGYITERVLRDNGEMAASLLVNNSYTGRNFDDNYVGLSDFQFGLRAGEAQREGNYEEIYRLVKGREITNEDVGRAAVAMSNRRRAADLESRPRPTVRDTDRGFVFNGLRDEDLDSRLVELEPLDDGNDLAFRALLDQKLKRTGTKRDFRPERTYPTRQFDELVAERHEAVQEGDWARASRLDDAIAIRRTDHEEDQRLYDRLVALGWGPDDAETAAFYRDESTAQLATRRQAIRRIREEFGIDATTNNFRELLDRGFMQAAYQGVGGETFTDRVGYTVNPEGERRGVSETDIIRGSDAFVRKYATPELLDYFEANGRVTRESFRAYVMGESASPVVPFTH